VTTSSVPTVRQAIPMLSISPTSYTV
jgi:hypothetical protein